MYFRIAFISFLDTFTILSNQTEHYISIPSSRFLNVSLYHSNFGKLSALVSAAQSTYARLFRLEHTICGGRSYFYVR
jgi:hypothetical protein